MSPSHNIPNTLYPRITGWGKYVPAKVLTNCDLEKFLQTSDEWVRSRTGIRERRIAADHETASSMATRAAKEALYMASVAPEAVDLVVVATSTAEKLMPSCASLVQAAVGASRAAAFDVNAACTGFIAALATAYQFVSAGTYQTVLVVGSEVYSRILDWSDRSTCVLFGDGAGAVLVQGSERPLPKAGIVLGSDGSQCDLLVVPAVADSPVDRLMNGTPYLKMEGQKLFKLAVTVMARATKEALESAGWTVEDIDLFIPHQANIRIIEAAVRILGVAPEKVFLNVEKYGNTASASIPMALCEAAGEGRLRPGDRVVLTGFGGGISWGAMALQWDPLL